MSGIQGCDFPRSQGCWASLEGQLLTLARSLLRPGDGGRHIAQKLINNARA
jgi:hypothetical protein